MAPHLLPRSLGVRATLGLVAVSVALSGCGGKSPLKAAPTVTVTVTTTPTSSPTPTDTPTPTESANSTDTPTPTESANSTDTPTPTDSAGSADTPTPTDSAGSTGTPSSNAGASPSAGTVPTSRAGEPLGLSDAQSATGSWQESRYEVADRSNVRGLGVSVSSCGDQGSTDVGLEYRLANRFKRLSMNVAQANSSPQSDQGLTVVVLANNKLLDTETVPFNQTKPVSLDVSGVNALQIRMFLDNKTTMCGGGRGVIAVVDQLLVN